MQVADWKPKGHKPNEYYYDPDIASKYTRFIENLCVQPDGFNPGKPICLLEYQKFIVDRLLGTLRYSEEHGQYVRQYIDVFIGIAKKNGKTGFIACLALALCVLESDKERQDIIIVAADIDQAKIMFEAAANMISMSPKLAKAFTVRPGYNLIKHNRSGGKIKVKAPSDKALYGLKPTVVIIDELVAQKNDSVYKTLHSSIVAKKEPLFITITTAGYKNDSPFCYEIWQDAKKTVSDPIRNTKQLVWINETPESADPADRIVWKESNPGLGITKDFSGLEYLFEETQRRPSALPEFQAMQLNQWVDTGGTWIPAHVWLASGGDAGVFDESLLADRECYGGLDLSKGVDFSSWALVFPGSPTDVHADGWTLLVRSWVSEASLDSRKDFLRTQIVEWSELPHAGEPWVTICPGTEIRQRDIEEQIVKDCSTFNVETIGADPHLVQYMAQNLAEQGIETMSIVQTYTNLSDPTKELEYKAISKKLWHGFNPVLGWMMGNVVLDMGTQGDIKINKKRKKEAIDGVAATINALHVALQPKPVKNDWEFITIP